MFRFLLVAGLAILAILAAAGWLIVRPARFRRRVARACARFPRQRSAAQDDFRQAARASGKPRGLRWERCDFHDNHCFAMDRASGELYALVGVNISFAAIEGGGMEEVEAVGNLRCATAILVHRDGVWTSDGRTVFNLEPVETLAHYQKSLIPLDR